VREQRVAAAHPAPNGIVLVRRPAKTAHAYATVWNKEGIAYQLMFNLTDAMHCYRTGTDDWFKFIGIQSTAPVFMFQGSA
jgi:protoheme ferro-lyase